MLDGTHAILFISVGPVRSDLAISVQAHDQTNFSHVLSTDGARNEVTETFTLIDL